MSFVSGSERGERADVARKLRVTDESVRLSRAMAMYRQRLDGRNDSEIGEYFVRSRQYVNGQINSLAAHVKAEVRRDRMRAIKADLLLASWERGELEFADAI